MADGGNPIDDQVEAAEELVESLNKVTAASKETEKHLGSAAVQMGELETALSEANAEQQALNQQLQDATLNLRERLDIEDDLINITRQELKAKIALANLRGEETKELIKQEKTLRLRGRYFNQIDSSTQNIASSIGLSFKFENSFLKAVLKSSEAVDGVSTGVERTLTNLEGLLAPEELLYGFAVKIFEETVKYNMELMAASKSLNKITGMSAKFAGDMDSAAHTFFLYGGSLEDAAGNIGTLVTGFNDFTSTSEDERTNLLRLSAEMNAIGISTDDFAASLNFLTKVQGKSTTQSAKFTKKLAEYGASIGRVPSEFVKEFVSATEKLSIYGDRIKNIFKSLEKRAKATGVSFDSLLTGADKFRDFSQVTKMIAMLNSQLGRVNLDPMEFLLMDDPDQQLGALREAIVATGQLERLRANSAERALLAETTGFSDADLMKILNNEFEQTNQQTADFNKLLEKSSSILDKLATIARSLAIAFTPVLNALDSMLGYITESKERTTGFAFAAAIALSILAKGFVVLAKKALASTVAMIATQVAVATTTATVATATGTVTTLGGAFLAAGAAAGTAAVGFSAMIWPITLIVGAVLALVAAIDFFAFDGAGMGAIFDFFGGTSSGPPKAHKGMTGYGGGPLTMKQDKGMTGYGGGPLTMKQDKVMTNVPSGTSVLTKGNSQTIETLLRDLTQTQRELNSSIKQLASGGSGEVVLKLDGKVLSRQLMKELKYSV
jgi:hypothetical protein